MRVFILLFNARTENEGIHTIQIGDPQSGSRPGQVRNKVLMFESEDDATRYALLLEAQDFPTATVEAFDSEEIEEFCRSAGYDWEIVQEGREEMTIPPENNLEEPDWKTEANQPLDAESEMSNAELERIRRQLEGLL